MNFRPKSSKSVISTYFIFYVHLNENHLTWKTAIVNITHGWFNNEWHIVKSVWALTILNYNNEPRKSKTDRKKQT